MSRVIFHIDVNSAFLSWTAVKRVMEGGQDIRLVPSVISGDPGDRRSIISAASIPAKRLGIRAAMPVTMALRLYPDLVIVRGDWEWYKRCSEGFIAICRSYSPVLQQFSIDECFIDMSLRIGTRHPVEVATRLKDEIRAKLGFTVNVGVGPNKLLAKMASDFEKPDKVHTLWENEIREKMWSLGVRNLLWVGKKTEERLIAYGIHTIGDLARLSVGQLTRLVGQKFAVQLHENANGRDDSPVETEVQEAKSYSAERTFPKDLADPKDIDRALFNVACIVAHRIRRDGFRASTVSMLVKYRDFSVAQKQCQTGQPTDITAVILNEARRMLAEVWDGVTPLRQVGLGVSKLTHETVEQMSLFEDPKMEYYREWDRQYDAARARAEAPRLLAYQRKAGSAGVPEVSDSAVAPEVSDSAGRPEVADSAGTPVAPESAGRPVAPVPDTLAASAPQPAGPPYVAGLSAVPGHQLTGPTISAGIPTAPAQQPAGPTYVAGLSAVPGHQLTGPTISAGIPTAPAQQPAGPTYVAGLSAVPGHQLTGPTISAGIPMAPAQQPAGPTYVAGLSAVPGHQLAGPTTSAGIPTAPAQQPAGPTYVILREVTAPSSAAASNTLSARAASNTLPAPAASNTPSATTPLNALSNALSVPTEPESEPLVFRYPDGEQALAAAKRAVRTDPSLRFHRVRLPDGADCFELTCEDRVIERYVVQM